MKVESCKHCVYAGQVYDAGSIIWVCSRTPEMPDRMVRVCHHAVCPRFRRRAEVTRRDEAIEQPADKDIRYIPLTQGRVATVDASDYAWLSLYRWHLVAPRGRCYAGRCRHGKRISMHREIMQPLDGYVVDHIDGDGLNNRRSNLRICTRAQNLRSQAKAARAYDRKAFEVFGEFAWLNFPEDYGRPPHRRPFSDSN